MKYGARLFEPRQGCCLHFDASKNDKGAVAWFADPRCEVSYQWLVTDDGKAHRLAPDDARAYHMGVCRPSEGFKYKDANSAFYGVAIAATDGDTCTPLQFATVVRLCAGYCQKHRWAVDRITGHKDEAWPRGRKHDPEGSTGVLKVKDVRDAVEQMLTL